jgi:hypothetical protein
VPFDPHQRNYARNGRFLFVVTLAKSMQVSPAAPAHETVDGEEQCTCRFTVRWKQGPRKGSSEEVGVERVCRVLSSPLQDPVLDEFLDGVTKLLGIDNKSASASQAMGSSEAADVGARDAPPGFHHQYGARM